MSQPCNAHTLGTIITLANYLPSSRAIVYGNDGYQLSGTIAPQEEMGDDLETVPTVCVTGEEAGFVLCEE
jgi:hypothetical protein